MSSDKTIAMAKAEAALEILLKYDEQNSDCSFKKVLAEIIEEWGKINFSKKVGKVNGLETQTLPTHVHTLGGKPTEGEP